MHLLQFDKVRTINKKMFREKQKHRKGHQRQNSGKMKIVRQDNPELTRYMNLLETLTKHEKIIILLDARAPQAGRYKTFEVLLKDKLIYCLNKIDLVPREIVIGWMSYLSTIAPTFAISATESAIPIIDYLHKNNIKDICITGLANIGKKTLAEKLSEFKPEVTKSWRFLITTYEHVITQAIDNLKLPVIIAHLPIFLDQCAPQSLMEVFGYTYATAPSPVFNILKGDSNDHLDVINTFLTDLWNGKYPFYAPPPTKTYDLSFTNSLSDPQKAELRKLKILDAFEKPFIVLTEPDALNKMIPSLLADAHKITKIEEI